MQGGTLERVRGEWHGAVTAVSCLTARGHMHMWQPCMEKCRNGAEVLGMLPFSMCYL
jgi:hypothetical protein